MWVDVTEVIHVQQERMGRLLLLAPVTIQAAPHLRCSLATLA